MSGSTTLQPLGVQKKSRVPDSRPTSVKKAPIYKDSSTETINFPSPQLGPRISITETPASNRNSMASPTSSTCSSVRSPVIVRQSVWTHRDSNSEHPVNFLNGSAGKRDHVRFEESSLIIKTNHRSDDEQSSKICLLFKPGLKGLTSFTLVGRTITLWISLSCTAHTLSTDSILSILNSHSWSALIPLRLITRSAHCLLYGQSIKTNKISC